METIPFVLAQAGFAPATQLLASVTKAFMLLLIGMAIFYVYQTIQDRRHHHPHA